MSNKEVWKEEDNWNKVAVPPEERDEFTRYGIWAIRSNQPPYVNGRLKNFELHPDSFLVDYGDVFGGLTWSLFLHSRFGIKNERKILAAAARRSKELRSGD